MFLQANRLPGSSSCHQHRKCRLLEVDQRFCCLCTWFQTQLWRSESISMHLYECWTFYSVGKKITRWKNTTLIVFKCQIKSNTSQRASKKTGHSDSKNVTFSRYYLVIEQAHSVLLNSPCCLTHKPIYLCVFVQFCVLYQTLIQVLYKHSTNAL